MLKIAYSIGPEAVKAYNSFDLSEDDRQNLAVIYTANTFCPLFEMFIGNYDKLILIPFMFFDSEA